MKTVNNIKRVILYTVDLFISSFVMHNTDLHLMVICMIFKWINLMFMNTLCSRTLHKNTQDHTIHYTQLISNRGNNSCHT